MSRAKVEWDMEARAVYVYLVPKDEWPAGYEIRTVDVQGDASLNLDVEVETDRVLGIDMTGEPRGAECALMDPRHWVLATRAFTLSQQAMLANWDTATGKPNGVIGGKFSLEFPAEPKERK